MVRTNEAPIIGKAGERGGEDQEVKSCLFDEQQERVPPTPSGEGGPDERDPADGAGRGAERRQRTWAEEARPVKAHICQSV